MSESKVSMGQVSPEAPARLGVGPVLLRLRMVPSARGLV